MTAPIVVGIAIGLVFAVLLLNAKLLDDLRLAARRERALVEVVRAYEGAEDSDLELALLALAGEVTRQVRHEASRLPWRRAPKPGEPWPPLAARSADDG